MTDEQIGKMFGDAIDKKANSGITSLNFETLEKEITHYRELVKSLISENERLKKALIDNGWK